MRLAPERRSAQIIRPRQFRTPEAVLGQRANLSVRDWAEAHRELKHDGAPPAEPPPAQANALHAIAVVDVTEFASWRAKSNWSLLYRSPDCAIALLEHFRPRPIVQPLPPPRSPLRALIRQLAARIAREGGL
jgi:hypothetical protein